MSDNAITDQFLGTDLPQKPVDENALREVQNKAKYSKSKEFGELKEKAQARIEFYQKFLPNGQPIGSASSADMQRKWELANIIVAEFQQLFDEYENAEQLLKDEFGE